MKTTSPKVSVLMSVYNGAKFLQEAIDSILNQTFTDFEFIIINDRSTDSTSSILIENAKRDSRIILVENLENLGLTKSLNKGLKLAKGKYIARQDADDISLPQRLEKLVQVLDSSQEVVLASCDIDIIDDQGQITGEIRRSCDSKLIPWRLIFINQIAGHSQVVFRHDTIKLVGGYNENFRFSQDYELWSRLSKVGEIVILPEVYLHYRSHKKSVSHENSEQQKALCLSITQFNIAELLGKEVTADEASTLQQFWLGSYWHHNFPSTSKSSFIHNHLKLLSEAFLAKTKQRPEKLTYGDLEEIIGNQFLIWLKSPLTSRHTIFSKIQLSYYASIWSSRRKVLTSWLTWLIRLPFDTSRSVRDKIFGLIFSGNLNAF